MKVIRMWESWWCSGRGAMGRGSAAGGEGTLIRTQSSAQKVGGRDNIPKRLGGEGERVNAQANALPVQPPQDQSNLIPVIATAGLTQ